MLVGLMTLPASSASHDGKYGCRGEHFENVLVAPPSSRGCADVCADVASVCALLTIN